MRGRAAAAQAVAAPHLARPWLQPRRRRLGARQRLGLHAVDDGLFQLALAQPLRDGLGEQRVDLVHQLRVVAVGRVGEQQ